MGLGGVSQTTSGVNNYWVSYLVRQSALAIERAYRARRPGDGPLHGGARTGERPPVLVLVPVRGRSAHPRAAGGRLPRPNDRDAGKRQPACRDAWLQRRHRAPRRAERLGLLRLDQRVPQRARAAPWRRRDRDGRVRRVGREPAGVSVGDLPDPSAVHRRQPPGRLPHPVQSRTAGPTRPERSTSRSATRARPRRSAPRWRLRSSGRSGPASITTRRATRSGERAPTSASSCRTSCSCSALHSACSPSGPLQRQLQGRLPGRRQRRHLR